MIAHAHVAAPQQLLFFSKVTQIAPNICFACMVGEEGLVASLTAVEDTGFETLYHVSFSDGHSDTFLVDGTRSSDGQRRFADTYGKAIAYDLRVLRTFLEANEQGIRNFRATKDTGENFNVWIHPKRDTFRVYFKGEYQFHFRKREDWEVRTSRKEKHYVIDQDLAELIGKRLDKVSP